MDGNLKSEVIKGEITGIHPFAEFHTGINTLDFNYERPTSIICCETDEYGEIRFVNDHRNLSSTNFKDLIAWYDLYNVEKEKIQIERLLGETIYRNCGRKPTSLLVG